jgi:hypothetical protein
VNFASLIARRTERFQELESEVSDPRFFEQGGRARAALRERSRLKQLLDDWAALQKAKADRASNADLAKSDDADMAAMAAEDAIVLDLLSDGSTLLIGFYCDDQRRSTSDCLDREVPVVGANIQHSLTNNSCREHSIGDSSLVTAWDDEVMRQRYPLICVELGAQQEPADAVFTGVSHRKPLRSFSTSELTSLSTRVPRAWRATRNSPRSIIGESTYPEEMNSM